MYVYIHTRIIKFVFKHPNRTINFVHAFICHTAYNSSSNAYNDRHTNVYSASCLRNIFRMYE